MRRMEDEGWNRNELLQLQIPFSMFGGAAELEWMIGQSLWRQFGR